MGRWKRKKAYYKKNGSQNGGGDGQAKPKKFSVVEKELIRQYLVDYRRGCERVCFSVQLGVTADDDTVVTSPTSSKMKRLFPQEKDQEDDDDDRINIGGHVFQALTDEVLSKPYMELPRTLQGPHRRCIHSLCVDCDLFHCGLGARRESRFLVVSIHSDGFRFVPELAQSPRPLSIPLGWCRPWYCRTPPAELEDSVRRGKSLIQALIDQPGDCLRDDQDAIDPEDMRDHDLSMSPPPTNLDQNWVLVESADQMVACAKELEAATPSVLAFDMEMYNPSKYAQATCLLQITSDVGKEYVIDTLAYGVWDQVPLLAPLFADPKVVKVGHCIGSMDVRSLHRDFGIYVVNAFDTMEASQRLRLPRNGLAHVCHHYGLKDSQDYIELKEVYQAIDWRQRPLTEPMIRYGRYDVHYLVALRKLLMRDLVQKSKKGQTKQEAAAEASLVASSLAETLQTIEQAEGDVVVDDDETDGREAVLADDDPVTDDRAIDPPTAAAELAPAAEEDDMGYFTPPDDGEPEEDDGYRTPTNDSRQSKSATASTMQARDLRLQPELMAVLTKSQYRCLDMWTSKTEDLNKNDMFLTILQRAQDGQLVWTSTHRKLLDDLVVWRNGAAQQMQVLPAMLCSLDFLVTIAWKRPLSEAAMRRIQYFLPQFLLEENGRLLQEIVAMVRASHKGNAIVDKSIRSYPFMDASGRRASPWWRYGTIAATAVVGIVAFAIVGRRKR